MFVQSILRGAIVSMVVASPLLVAAQNSGAPAAQPLSLAVVAPVVDCSALASVDISAAVGAPTHITAATVAKGPNASYCKVQGYVDPSIKFEVHLPVSTWTQRLVQNGCGGLCGNLNVREYHATTPCTIAANGELAITSTDMGHSGQGAEEGSFGDDYQLRVDFAYRGVHLTTLAAKALIAKYYGRAPKFSYFMGCSDGGREALMEAQRYPEDFNGIAAGAAAQNFITQNTFYHAWNALMTSDADGKPILNAEAMQIAHKAVVAQCDPLDGLKDGLISEPLSCHPDLTAVQCKAGQDAATCLTAVQVHAIMEIYRGAHDAQGGKLVLSGPMPGSELGWAGLYFGTPDHANPMSPSVSTGVLKHLAYDVNPTNFKLTDLKFDRATFDAATRYHSIYDSTDPNLKPFSERGGKLIMYHGLADFHISPVNSIAYYTAMQKLMGAAAVDKFARLFLFPGGYHCGGGEGPFSMDLLTAIMAWTERGVAPSVIIASHSPEVPRAPVPAPASGGTGAVPGSAGGPPLPSVTPATPKPDRTRPVYPYPYTAQYTGKGSIDDAANFVQGPAKPVPASALEWFGSGFYTVGYEKWCTGKGATFVCNNTK